MNKYGVLENEGQAVEIVAGPHKGKSGIVKASKEGTLTVDINGQYVKVSEDSAKTKAQ
jgi:ribosomal protein L24